MPLKRRVNESHEKPGTAATRVKGAAQSGAPRAPTASMITRATSQPSSGHASSVPLIWSYLLKILAYSYAIKGMCLPLLALMCPPLCRRMLQIHSFFYHIKGKKEGRKKKDKCILLAWRLPSKHQLKEGMISNIKAPYKVLTKVCWGECSSSKVRHVTCFF